MEPKIFTIRLLTEKLLNLSWNRESTKASEKDGSEPRAWESENLMLYSCAYVQGDFLVEVRLNLGIGKGQWDGRNGARQGYVAIFCINRNK